MPGEIHAVWGPGTFSRFRPDSGTELGEQHCAGASCGRHKQPRLVKGWTTPKLLLHMTRAMYTRREERKRAIPKVQLWVLGSTAGEKVWRLEFQAPTQAPPAPKDSFRACGFALID